MLFGRSFSIKRIALQTGNENGAKADADLIKFNYKIAFLEHINGFQAWLIMSSWCPGEEASFREEVHRVCVLPSDKTALLPSERVS